MNGFESAQRAYENLEPPDDIHDVECPEHPDNLWHDCLRVPAGLHGTMIHWDGTAWVEELSGHGRVLSDGVCPYCEAELADPVCKCFELDSARAEAQAEARAEARWERDYW